MRGHVFSCGRIETSVFNSVVVGLNGAVISLPNGEWCGFEIKLGANQIDAAAQNLTRIRDEIRKDGGKEPAALCVVCGLSNAAYMRPDGVYVVPIPALKN